MCPSRGFNQVFSISRIKTTKVRLGPGCLKNARCASSRPGSRLPLASTAPRLKTSGCALFAESSAVAGTNQPTPSLTARISITNSPMRSHLSAFGTTRGTVTCTGWSNLKGRSSQLCFRTQTPRSGNPAGLAIESSSKRLNQPSESTTTCWAPNLRSSALTSKRSLKIGNKPTTKTKRSKKRGTRLKP